MYGTIIVGVDLDAPDRAQDAIAMGAWLASDTLHLATVFAPELGDPRAQRERREEALRSLAGGCRATVHALPGTSPARLLHELADRIRPDAIVVGSSRDGSRGAVCPGSVAELLLHGGGSPVIVVPPGFRTVAGPATVGVAFGATPESEEALRHGAAVAAATGARLRVLTIPETATTPAVIADAPGWADERLVQALALTPLPAEHRRLDGDPAEALAAASAGLDLLVVGSRSYGPLGAVLLGAVTRRLVRRARCPVMVVPRTPDPAHEVALVGGMEAPADA